MKCSSCGSEIPDECRFCTKCGSKIIVETVVDNDGINNDDIKSTPASYPDAPTEIEASDGNPHDAGGEPNKAAMKGSFVWKEQYTYISIVAVIVIAALIGLAVKFNKASNNGNDGRPAYDEYEATEKEHGKDGDDIEEDDHMEKDDAKEDDTSETEDKSLTVEADDSEKQDETNALEKTSGYILEDSASRNLTDADVAGLTLQEINYAKNEIYARHGRRFNSRELQEYFDSTSWYVGRYSPEDFDQNYSENVLNEYEKRNADFLREKEFAMAPNGYQLDANHE